MLAWSQWQDTIRFDEGGPVVTLLHESSELKVVLVGLKAGQGLPAHPGPAASFVFLQGEAVMVVDDEEVAVAAGALVVVPSGAGRAVRALTDVAFVGNLGDPASERAPHQTV